MSTGDYAIIDIHAHFCSEKELEIRRNHSICTCFSSGTPGEWESIKQFRKREELMFSFGIHPWYADRYEAGDCGDYLRECDMVGEIGMDSVWCRVPLAIQQKRFEKQLQIAADLGKPVILHTKGQESRIAEILRDFPGRACVHWYSGGRKEFEKFLDMDCFFTLGPDIAEVCRNRRGEKFGIYRLMMKEISAERMFVETDGIPAVAWIRGTEDVKPEELPVVLKKNMEFAAAVKKMKAQELAKQMQRNLLMMLNRS